MTTDARKLLATLADCDSPVVADATLQTEAAELLTAGYATGTTDLRITKAGRAALKEGTET